MNFDYRHYKCFDHDYDGPTGNSLGDLYEYYTDKVISFVRYRKPHRHRERRVIKYTEVEEIDLGEDLCPSIHGRISIPQLEFTQTFQINSSETAYDIFLETPLELKKSISKYSVELFLMFKCCIQNRNCNYNMKIHYCQTLDKKKNVDGTVVVSPNGCPLKNIRFQNIPNRE